MSARYWLSEWIDDNAFTVSQDVERSLLSPTVVRELRSKAIKAYRIPRDLPHGESHSTSFSILAGRGIDLSGQLVCSSEICRRRQVDELFGRVWHYFDRIIVNDNLSRDIQQGWDVDTEVVKRRLISAVEVLLYLRQIGAEELVEFRPKPPTCIVHWNQHATEAGLVNLTTRLEEITDSFSSGATVRRIRNDSETPKFRVSHPLFEIPHTVLLNEELTRDLTGSLERQALTIVVRRLIAHLSSDIAAAHRYRASLGTVLKTHELFLSQLRPTSVADVVLNLKLPVLEGLLTSDLIDIRRDESEYFTRFRDSLTKVVGERLKLDNFSDPAKLAEELRQDLIEPRIRDISTRLLAAQKLVTKKSGVGLVLGAISTTCGVISGLDPHMAMMGGTGITLACTGTAASKYLDEKRDIELDDMYFLWKATECAPHPD